MEQGVQNGVGARSSFDRDLKAPNGINGASKREPSPNKPGKTGGALINNDTDAQKQAQPASSASDQAKIMSTLPPEIAHITANYFPLPFILQRLAQRSHNDLQTKIEELARIQVGQGAVNGNVPGAGEDSSEENQNKKANLLTFIQEMHSQWVKALVMSEWGRKSEQVSKLIDLHAHIMEQIRKYELMLDRMGNIKRNLYNARLPAPDIKTALHVLSTGEAPFLPDFNFIPPPEQSAPEIKKWMDELNVLLSVRLNLDEYDKIPHWFRDYTIDNGRVTFKVNGEFEVDLTIADDDFEKQWWFLDVRFAFSPAPAEPSDVLRFFVEGKVNESLEAYGLQGCYEYLHEYVLTHKIQILRQQAVVLSRRLWVDHTKVETLKRALSIQYWSQRYPAIGPKKGVNSATPAGPKSWFIIGVNSAKTPPRNALLGAPVTSSIVIRWFRDGKEVKDEDLSFDTEEISAEALLKQIIGQHVKHILSSIYQKLLSKPRYANRQASVSLSIDNDEPSDSYLMVQLTHEQTLKVRIDAITGSFVFHPHSNLISRRQIMLNTRGKDSVEDGLAQIEALRSESLFEELTRRGRSMGWGMCRQPVQQEEMRKLHPSKEPHPPIWLKHESWNPSWFLVVSSSSAGDVWWLVSIIDNTPPKAVDSTSTPTTKKPVRTNRSNARHNILDQPTVFISSFTKLPINSHNPEFSNEFFVDIATMTADTATVIEDVGVLTAAKADRKMKAVRNPHLSSRLTMPALVVGTGVFLNLPSIKKGEKSRRQNKVAWAGDAVEIITRNVRNRGAGRLEITREAKVFVKDMRKVSLLKKGFIDRDVYYDPKQRHFRLDLRIPSHQSCMGILSQRLKAIDRLVDFVASINGIDGVNCESVTLRKVIFTYSDPGSVAPATHKPWKVTLDLVRNNTILSLEPDNPHVRILDMLKKLINSPVGFEQLPYWLQTTLPLHRALESIESAWDSLSRNGQGLFDVVPHAVDWVAVRFELPSSTPNKPPRKLSLSVRVMDRHGENWWAVRYGREDARSDDFNGALGPIFTSAMSPEGWTGLGQAAAAPVNGGGIETLLTRISDAVKAMATSGLGASSGAGTGTGAGSSQGAPITLD